MRLPFFGARTGNALIRLPLPELVEIRFGVYFRARDSAPAAEGLLEDVRAWIDRHVPNPLGGALQAYLGHDLLTLAVDCLLYTSRCV